MSSIMELTAAVMDCVPADRLSKKIYRQTEPDANASPPWIIITCTTRDHNQTETGSLSNHIGRLEIRTVAETSDSTDIDCDDKIIPALQNARPFADGFEISPLILDQDSGSYLAGITASETARRWSVRVLRFRFSWTRTE